MNPDDPNDHVVFKRDADGRWSLAASDAPFWEFQRAAWYQCQPFVVAALGFVLGVSLLSLMLWPIAVLIRRHYSVRLELRAPERRARNWTRSVAAINVIFWIAMPLTTIAATSNIELLAADWLSPTLRVIQAIGVMSLLGGAIVVYSAFLMWRVPALWWWTRVQHTLLALACVVSSWLIAYAHVISLGPLRY